jgi:hypothetical protein
MIYIEKNMVNDVVLELSDVLASDQIYFLFSFTPENEVNPVTQYYIGIDVSVNPCRFNHFEITESDSGGFSPVDASAINLNAGQYVYKVYSSNNIINTSNYTSLLTNEPVEIGRMVVVGVNAIIDPIYQ